MELLPALFLLVLWFAGVPVRFLAGLMGGALLLEGLVNRRLSKLRLPRALSAPIIIGVWSSIVFAVGLFRFWCGDQGIDFAIFTQAMQQFAAEGDLSTSLVSTTWVNFLTHHFSLVLAAIGLVIRVGVTPQIAAIGFHAAAIGASLWILAKLGAARRIPGAILAVVLVLVILHPSFRNPVLWEVHDEVYGAPFLLLGVLALDGKRIGRAIAWFLIAALCKETIFLIAAFACIGAVAADFYAPRTFNSFSAKQRGILAAAAALFVGCFLLYTRVLPYRLFEPSFDFTARIASLSELANPELIWKKLWWGFALFAVPGLLLLSLQRSLQIRCTSPRAAGAAFGGLLYFCAVVAVTNFDSALNPYTYYHIVPVLFIGALMLTLLPSRLPHQPALVAGTLCLCFCFGASSGPINSLYAAKSINRDLNEVNRIIPAKTVVVASDWDAAWLIDNRQVLRLYHANRNNMKFDYVVERRDRGERLSLYLRAWSRPCFANANYLVRCALPSRATDKRAMSRLLTAWRTGDTSQGNS